jgi:protocatechuate 3,4-dioxygenase beta subunit
MEPSEARRDILRLLMLAPAAMMLHPKGAAAQRQGLAPTPACGDDDDKLTPSQTAGPYFKPRSPQRSNLIEPGEAGARLRLTGQVLSADCRPLSAALLDLRGFRHRGHLFADESGRFELLTVVPGLYPGRTRHLHVRVQPRGAPILTTQLYFPDEPLNRRDGLFSPALLMRVAQAQDEVQAHFTFVVAG